MTAALAGVDGASLHRHMLTADMASWGIAVLEYVDTLWWARIRERAWWHELRRWVVNDVSPGIPQDGKPQTNHWLNQKVLRQLKEIKQAEYHRDFAPAAGMRSELTTLSQSLDIPLAYGASVVVPNVTHGQKSLIYRQLVRTLQTTHLKAWEKQAVKRAVRVVQATPHTVETVFSKLSTKKDWVLRRPRCTYTEHLHTASKYGELVTIGQHVALVPVTPPT